jgi:uncharacterized membrane protein
MMDRKAERKRRIYPFIYLATVLVCFLFLLVGNRIATENLTLFNNDGSGQEVMKASVKKITDRTVDEYSPDGSTTIENVQITFQAEILSGSSKGKTVDAIQNVDSSLPFNGTTEIKEGDKILLIYTSTEGMGEIEGTYPEWQFMEFVRTDKLLVLGIIFIIVLLLFGRAKGFNTLLALAFTCTAVFAVFIPSILSGKNIYISSIIICLYTIVMTYLIVNGYNKKTLGATLGCFGGIIISGLLTVIMNTVLALTGIVNEESIYLTYLETETPIDLKAIIFAAIIIGALGAIMDVAMSISSSLWEVRDKADSVSFESLYKSGMNIGRDVMGTMVNTLILAYIGSSLSVVLLLSVYSPSLLYLLNREMVVIEILQSLIGSFGLLFTLPLTSFICAMIYVRDKKQAEKYTNDAVFHKFPQD